MIGDWVAFPVGMVIATLATMVGVGGGILWTPYLIFVAGLNPSEAVLTSLLIQVVGMGSGGVAAVRKKTADLRLALIIAGVGVPGLACGVWLKEIINPESLVFILGVACMATALMFVTAREEYDFHPRDKASLSSVTRSLWIPPILSVLTGLLSIGVGDFLVPIFRGRLGLKMDAAIGSCLIIMSINAAVAAGFHLLTGERFPLNLFCWAAVGVLAGGQIGPRIADRIADQTLKEIFIYGLSLVGIHILFNV